MNKVEIFGPGFSTFVRTLMLACEEKSIPYRQHMEWQGEPVAMHSDSHFQLHPFGKVPVLIDDGRVLTETCSILRYLEAVYPQHPLQPADAFDRALLDQWCGYISGYVDQALIRRYLLEFVFPKGEGGTVREDRVERALPGLHEVLAMLEKQLADQPFLMGDTLTLADLLLLPMLDYLLAMPQSRELMLGYSALVSYTERLRQRPSAQLVLAAS
ncbi:glutathione S-transferase family protein [Pontibacter sp. JAM-7]|uniref:glutathione S-transferase family protein n=1 Tax=Pontibacter sp. JAM-7 TaxID=3366581 RepID=UPI003AF99C59